jgi:hypothetical protein
MLTSGGFNTPPRAHEARGFEERPSMYFARTTRPSRVLAAAAAVLSFGAAHAAGGHARPHDNSCPLGNGIQHIVYIQFDNVHIERDNPNVPSDLEQMPTLLGFLTSKGSFLTNHHTPLISPTSSRA